MFTFSMSPLQESRGKFEFGQIGIFYRLIIMGFLFFFLTNTDYDPQVIEQKEQSQPSCLPLSYVLRFITDAARKEGPFLGTSGAELKRKLAIKHHSYSMSSSNRSNTPTGKRFLEFGFL